MKIEEIIELYKNRFSEKDIIDEISIHIHSLMPYEYSKFYIN